MNISYPLILFLFTITAYLFYLNQAFAGSMLGILTTILLIFKLTKKASNWTKEKTKIITEGLKSETNKMLETNPSYPKAMIEDIAHHTAKTLGGTGAKKREYKPISPITQIINGSKNFLEKLKEWFS